MNLHNLKLILKWKIQEILHIPYNIYMIIRFPFLRPRVGYFGQYCWYRSIPIGWRKAFGIQLCKEIKQALKRNGCKDFVITDVKEKFGCYDDETEVLTKAGWKLFKDVNYNDDFFTLNKSTNVIEYQKPSDIIKYKYSGKMYKLVNRGIDLLVTPNHNLYVSKGSYFNYRKKEKHVYEMELVAPHKYFLKDKRFLKGGGIWLGENMDFFEIPECEYEYFQNRPEGIRVCHKKYESIKFEMIPFLKFLGFYVAEGYSRKSTISIAFNPKDEEELVCDLINNIGLEYSSSSPGLKRINNRSFADWLNRECGHLAWNKKVPEFIKKLPPELIKIFLEYLYIGDGHKSKTSNILTTTSKKLSDDVQELLLKCGYSFREYKRNPKKSHKYKNIFITNKRPIFEINWLKNSEIEIEYSKVKNGYIKKYIEDFVDYDGFVYCVTVPNHIIYVRRNGKGCWCGNSLRIYEYGSPKEVQDIINKYEYISENTCIKCGAIATRRSQGYILPYCDNCNDNHTSFSHYYKDYDFYGWKK